MTPPYLNGCAYLPCFLSHSSVLRVNIETESADSVQAIYLNVHRITPYRTPFIPYRRAWLTAFEMAHTVRCRNLSPWTLPCGANAASTKGTRRPATLTSKGLQHITPYSVRSGQSPAYSTAGPSQKNEDHLRQRYTPLEGFLRQPARPPALEAHSENTGLEEPRACRRIYDPLDVFPKSTESVEGEAEHAAVSGDFRQEHKRLGKKSGLAEKLSS